MARTEITCDEALRSAALSPAETTTTDSIAIEEHLAECPSCAEQWRLIAAAGLCPSGSLPRGNASAQDSMSTPTILPVRIGSFRIVRELGRGGMGVVYEARQDSPDRTVALKVAVGGRFTDEYHRRLFLREAQALARLQHPNIAAFYEAGTTPEGEHYFAMELVDGRPLGGHVGSAEPTVVQRLLLMRAVCEAINYAHLRGVLHLDLKPSNIVVDEMGAAKVLDFGLARLTDAGGGALSTVLSVYAHGRGTLPYMSPEQISARPEAVDVRSDVYSLGVILYELLTGRLPFAESCASAHQLMDAIVREEPRRPGAHCPGIADELDAITLKALEKDPARRYQSAQALGEDIGRFLSGDVVAARAPTAGYRLQKLVARHKFLCTSSAIILSVVLASSVWMSALYTRARSAERLASEHLRIMTLARDEAARQAENHRAAALRAEQITGFLEGTIASADPYRGSDGPATVRQLLDEATARAGSELAGFAELEARVSVTLGNAYVNLGAFDRAEERFARAIQLQVATGGDQLFLAETLLQRANARRRAEAYLPAEDDARRAAEIREKTLGRGHVQTILARLEIARMQIELRRVDEAAALAAECCKELTAAAGPEDKAVAGCLAVLASARHVQGDLVTAVEHFRRALSILASAGGEPADVHYVLEHLSWALRGLGDLDAADQARREALALARAYLGDRHPAVVGSLGAYAQHRVDQGRLIEAEQLAQESLRIKAALYPAHPERCTQEISRLAGVHWAKGDYPTAERMFRQALELDTRRGAPLPRIASLLNSLGVVLRDQERFDESRALLLRSLTMTRAEFGDDDPNTANVLCNLGRLHCYDGDHAAAEPLVRAALAIRQAYFPGDHAELTEAHVLLGMVLTGLSAWGEAESELRTALEARERTLAPGHWHIAEARSALGEWMMHMGRLREAELLLLDAQATIRASLDESHIYRCLTERRLARLHELSRAPLAAR